MKNRKLTLVIGLFVLFLSVLACTINIGGPNYPQNRIPVSTDAVGELKSAIQTSVAAGLESGQVMLVITESQLTSYMAASLQTQPFFTEPQVYLQDGQIQIYGLARQGYLQATVEIVVTAGVDAQGQLKIVLTTANFGSLPVPVDLKDAITATIQEAYTGSIGPAAVGFRLEDITIANGTMTIIGRTK